MKNWSIQSKSFFILFAIAVIGSLINMFLLQGLLSKRVANPDSLPGDYQVTNYSNHDIIPVAEASEPAADTTNWPTYTNEKLGLSFKYAPDWKIKEPITKNGWQIITIDPGKKFYNIHIYASDQGFFGMDSLPMRQENINGKFAVNVSDMLYGIQNGQSYFTFDMGYSVSLKPMFKGMVQSVSFTR